MTKVLGLTAALACSFLIGCGGELSEDASDALATQSAALEFESAGDEPVEATATPGNCECGNNCPFPIPEPNCTEGQKVCKQKRDCNFTIACDGQIVECSLKVKYPVCVPKGTGCGQL